MKKKLLLSLIVMIVLAACKKEPVETPISLKGKWSVENSVYKEYDNAILIDTETEPGNGTTVDFQDNGNVVITSAGPIIESFPYSIQSDSKVVFDGDTYDVKNLTASTVTLYMREDFGPGDYFEISLNLKR